MRAGPPFGLASQLCRALAHPGDPTLRLRADAISESDQHAAFAAIAPAESAGYYLVPKVIE